MKRIEFDTFKDYMKRPEVELYRTAIWATFWLFILTLGEPSLLDAVIMRVAP